MSHYYEERSEEDLERDVRQQEKEATAWAQLPPETKAPYETQGKPYDEHIAKVKREKEAAAARIVYSTPKGKYVRTIKGVKVDVYDVLKGFNITCPAMQHALKKMLCTGMRGHKGFHQDAEEAIESIKRAQELNT